MTHLDDDHRPKWYGPTNTPGPASAEGLKTPGAPRAGLNSAWEYVLNEERKTVSDLFDLEGALEEPQAVADVR